MNLLIIFILSLFTVNSFAQELPVKDCVTIIKKNASGYVVSSGETVLGTHSSAHKADQTGSNAAIQGFPDVKSLYTEVKTFTKNAGACPKAEEVVVTEPIVSAINYDGGDLHGAVFKDPGIINLTFLPADADSYSISIPGVTDSVNLTENSYQFDVTNFVNGSFSIQWTFLKDGEELPGKVSRFTIDKDVVVVDENPLPDKTSYLSVTGEWLELNGAVLDTNLQSIEIQMDPSESEGYQWACCKSYDRPGDSTANMVEQHNLLNQNNTDGRLTLDLSVYSDGFRELYFRKLVNNVLSSGNYVFFTLGTPVAVETGIATASWEAPTERVPVEIPDGGEYTLEDGSKVTTSDKTFIKDGAVLPNGTVMIFEGGDTWNIINGTLAFKNLPLEEIANYELFYKCGDLPEKKIIIENNLLTKIIDGLPVGETCSFQMTTVDTDGLVSDRSTPPKTKTITSS